MVLGLLNYIRARESTEAFISDAREARKAAVSSDFLKEFYGPEFMVVRSQSWDEVHEFCRNDDMRYRQVALFLIDSPEFEALSPDAPVAKTASNHQTPLQNLSRLVNFWHRVSVYSKLDLVNLEMLRPLKHEHSTWLPFFEMVVQSAKSHLNSAEADNNRQPDWLKTLVSIGKFL